MMKENKKQVIGLAIAITYFVLIFAMAIVIHCNFTVVETARKNGLGGEIFLVPVFLILSYLLYDKIVRKVLLKYMYK